MASFREQGTTDRFEKRELPRFPVQLPVQIGHVKDDLSSICTNLSRAGVSVETADSMAIGDRVAITVVLAPKEEPLRMVGKVIWIREIGSVDSKNRKIHEIGIRFLRALPTPQPYLGQSETDVESLPEADSFPVNPVSRQ